MSNKPFKFFFSLFFVAFSMSCSADNITAGKTMNCNNSAIKKSSLLIRYVLDDIEKNYHHTGGGGISEIKQTQTNVFVVSIAQEERIDQLTYAMEIDDGCKITLLEKSESTINFSR